MTKTKKVIGKNSQQLLFIQGLLQSIKKGEVQQNKSFRIGVTEKYYNIPAEFEIYPNCNGFIVWRIITEAGEGLWQTWETEDEITNTFRSMSLL